MGLYSLRSGKDSALFRIASIAHRHRLTPNMITAIGLGLGMSCGFLFAFHQVLPALLVGLGSVFCDVLDGAIARTFHLESKFGLMFDSVSDRLSELAVVFGALVGGVIQLLGVFAIVGSTTLFLLRTVSHRRGLGTDYVLFGRVERLTFILLGLISPVVSLSTFCFVAAGAFGIFSSLQIVVVLLRHSANGKLYARHAS